MGTVKHSALAVGQNHVAAYWSASGAPTVAAAEVGKIWQDTDDNTLWLATAAGTPGTFVQISLADDGAGELTVPTDLAVTNDLSVGGNIELTGDLKGGIRSLSIYCVTGLTSVEAVDGIAYIQIPEMLNGAVLSRANATHVTAGSGGTSTTIDIYNATDSVDMLSSAITINTGGVTGTEGTIDAANDDVATDDVIRIDITTQGCSTAPKGLMVSLEFTDPIT